MSAIGCLWFVPLLAGLAASLAPLDSITAWRALLAHPQFWPALLLSLWTGAAGFGLSLSLAMAIVFGCYGTRCWQRLTRSLGAFLAVPHLAFAIGFAFLIMPAGFLARSVAAIAGWSAPPEWSTVHDPLGLALIACLVLKETPFLVWTMWSVLQRGDLAENLNGQWRAARSLGHPPRAIWAWLLFPQLLPLIALPLIAVWAYGASVVDMALVIGPTRPPTLAVIAWNDLNHAEADVNARGAAGALLLALVLAGLAACLVGILRIAAPLWRVHVTGGPAPYSGQHGPIAPALLWILVITYGGVIAALLLISLAGPWPFPALFPDALHLDAWARLVEAPKALLTSLMLAVSSAAISLAFAVLWFETMSARTDRAIAVAAGTAVGLPALLIASGQYAVFLRAGLTGTASGLLLVHMTPVFSYVFFMLRGSYRSFDQRWQAVAAGLGCSRFRFWREIKAPLLRPVLAASAAVGFAVSMVQFIAAQLIASGRFTTLPIEAVTLASGGSRPLTAVFALALFVPVALAFLIAARLGQARWTRSWA